jgi:hypothetical protein
MNNYQHEAAMSSLEIKETINSGTTINMKQIIWETYTFKYLS